MMMVARGRVPSPSRRFDRRRLVLGGLGSWLVAGCGRRDSGASSGTRPVQHALGTTQAPTAPTRIVTLTSRDTDTLLGFGIVPVGIHTVYRFASGVGPWAEQRLTGARPTVWIGGELDYEAIASTGPDLILNVNAGNDRDRYERLSGIAPTIALPVGAQPFGATPAQSLGLIGESLGRADQATQLLAEYHPDLDRRRAAHPDFASRTATYLDMYPGGITAYPPTHVVNDVLGRIGFRPTAGSQRIAPGTGNQTVSPENIADYLADVTLIYPFGQTSQQLFAAAPLLRRAARNRTLIVLDDLAFSNGSVLSIDYALDELLPQLSR